MATREQVAAALGIEIREVRAIERGALRKLRAWCKAAGLAMDDLIAEQPEPQRFCDAIDSKDESV